MEKKKSKNSLQRLIGFLTFTKYGVKTDKYEFIFYHVEPTNISVLPPEVIANKMHDLAMVLSVVPELEIMALDTEEQVYELRSPLPYIDHVENISKLNELAEKIAALDNADLVKLKAVMELGEIENVEETIEIIDSLSEFEFDSLPRDENSYGKKYLQKLLPQDFDIEVLEVANLADIGSRILEAKGGMVTSYGIISGQGQELYAPLCQEQEHNEDEEMEASLT